MPAVGGCPDQGGSRRDDGPPTLVFAGSEDALPATLGRQAAERLGYMTYRELPGLDHMQAVLRDDLVLPLLREFWSSLE